MHVEPQDCIDPRLVADPVATEPGEHVVVKPQRNSPLGGRQLEDGIFKKCVPQLWRIGRVDIRVRIQGKPFPVRGRLFL